MSAPEVILSPEVAAEDKGPAIIAVIVVVTILETLFTLARLYVRGRIMRHLQLDDYLIILAVICGWCAVIFGILAVSSGNGKHFAILNDKQKSGAILWTIVGFCPGIMSFGVPKLAVIHLLTRLMNPSRIHRIFLWFLGTLCILSLLGCVVVLFAQCTPARAQWDFSLERKCWSPWVLVNYAIYAGSLSAATDLYLAVYPAVVLFGLRIPFRKKVALSAALGIGSVATVVAIYKTTRLPNLASQDFSYDTSDLVIWTCVEGSTIIIAACIPVLQPLADKLTGGRFFSSKTRRNYKHYGSERSGARVGQSDVELSYHGRKRQVKDPNALTFLDQTKVGSEESILGDKENQVQESSKQRRQSLQPGVNIVPGRITRTDVIEVSHSSGSQQTLHGIPEQGRRHV
ncbi:hypothetical protein SAPIO_CDS10502 [Scedosporium apiospermum]|uniref:Rhodopsin domain-containing protein n=1 Tax=Pseudallescheria apiosperma TaxID=563466 RepID=A0A084FVK0_PSEDA|nr:uncharacterized protein SAPIO_CDS10502 [Scedosporium apiospermum]KEZ39112.1 hypothetical protein SAPIO_CDS10502 [Scedosporium apiospermum]